MIKRIVKKKVITLQDCEELKQKLEKYCETAEQHECLKLFMLNEKMDATLEEIRKTKKVPEQEEMRAMFRCVLQTIGEDISAYEDTL